MKAHPDSVLVLSTTSTAPRPAHTSTGGTSIVHDNAAEEIALDVRLFEPCYFFGCDGSIVVLFVLIRSVDVGVEEGGSRAAGCA
jgi:hypothetical protein